MCYYWLAYVISPAPIQLFTLHIHYALVYIELSTSYADNVEIPSDVDSTQLYTSVLPWTVLSDELYCKSNGEYIKPLHGCPGVEM